jgi:hypothetical protein
MSGNSASGTVGLCRIGPSAAAEMRPRGIPHEPLSRHFDQHP